MSDEQNNNERLLRMEGKVDQMVTQVARIETKMEDFGLALSRLLPLIDQWNVERGGRDGQYQHIVSKIGHLDERINNLEKAVDARLTAIDSDVTSLKQTRDKALWIWGIVIAILTFVAPLLRDTLIGHHGAKQ